MIDVDAADEALLLDLLNSRPVIDGAEQDALAGDGAGWLRARGLPATGTRVRAARELRDALTDVVLGRARPSTLGLLLADTAARPQVSAAGVTWGVGGGDPLAVRTVLAWGELQRHAPGRLRPCGNPECRLFLLDRSRANTARWCSMATCGNRMKARRHSARAREA